MMPTLEPGVIWLLLAVFYGAIGIYLAFVLRQEIHPIFAAFYIALGTVFFVHHNRMEWFMSDWKIAIFEFVIVFTLLLTGVIVLLLILKAHDIDDPWQSVRDEAEDVKVSIPFWRDPK